MFDRMLFDAEFLYKSNFHYIAALKYIPKTSPFAICNWVAKRYKAKHGRAWPKKKHESCIRQLKKQLQHSK